jgi:hypothetical protein
MPAHFPETETQGRKRLLYNRLLLLVAGLGGLLYGVDVGIIGGALPYLEATSGLSVGQLSIVVAAVLLGSVISYDCPGSWVRTAVFRTFVARHQRWRYWRRRASLPC